MSAEEYGDFCVNHVEGCSHGCLYPCYAMMMKRRSGAISTYEEWLKPRLVSNALDLLEKEIPKYQERIKFVHLCFSTDPFMYSQGEVADLSIKIIKRLNESGVPCTLLTKGVYPVDDLQPLSLDNKYGITLVSLNEDFRRAYEPHAATFEERIDGLRRMHEKGLKTWASLEPYPTPNIITQDLRTILEKISFVDEIIFGKLNYNSKVGAFAHAKQFYNSQANVVMEFCQRNKIQYHIKTGTLTES